MLPLPSIWVRCLLLFVSLLGLLTAVACNNVSNPSLPAEAQAVTPQVIVVTATPDGSENSAIAASSPLPIEMTVVVTVVVTATPAAETATEQPTATATLEPTATVEPTATLLPEPTATPPPEPTAVISVSALDWLPYLNYFRQLAGLSDLTENIDYSFGDTNHTRYMVNTGRLTHFEKGDVEWFSSEGDAAAKKSNIAASQVASSPDQWAIEYWISAPFHLVPIIDPELTQVGFGVYRSAGNTYNMTAALDVLRGVRRGSATITYPIMFPRDGGETWVIRHSLFEYPGPKASCPGFPNYPDPVGAPIVAQIGSGDQTPRVSAHSLSANGIELPHCIFDETNYVNADETQQRIGRIILDERDAIVILPRQPLVPGTRYDVRLVTNGQPIEWSFTAVNKPKN
jgi:uncharacterized protein YkwD